jgi:YebC/PmpR family DNA-binding regulatory protein
MSGHSKWATIKRSKGKADAARGRIFNRLIREITVAARMGGGNPDSNPRLRSAIASSRENNMPGKNVETAILKGTGQLEGVNYEEVTWEAYGPNGVAMLIDTMTDNRNRTVAEVRHVLTRHGGNIGNTGSVSYMFKKKGIIRIPIAAKDEDSLMEIVLEAGAEDLKNDGEEYEVVTNQESFDAVKNALTKIGITPTSSEVSKIADTKSTADVDTQVKVMRLVDALDELDDTQHVYTNCDFSDEAAEKYSKEA